MKPLLALALVAATLGGCHETKPAARPPAEPFCYAQPNAKPCIATPSPAPYHCLRGGVWQGQAMPCDNRAWPTPPSTPTPRASP
jgi:hypothetical protein